MSISYGALNGPALVDDAQLVEKKICEPNLEITVEKQQIWTTLPFVARYIFYLLFSHSYLWFPLFPSPSPSPSLSYSPFLSPFKLWQTKIIQKEEAFEMRSTVQQMTYVFLFETL
jgi:hypothetical protein